MMSSKIKCTLHGERATFWKGVFGTDTVCILSSVPITATLPDFGVCEIYMLDLEALEPEQKTRLADVLSQKFDLPLDETIWQMDELGVPILAEGCTVTVSESSKSVALDEDPYDFYNDEKSCAAHEPASWRDDINRCPECGSDIDADGFCSDMECGWWMTDDWGNWDDEV